MCGLLGVTINPNELQLSPERVSLLLTNLMVANEDRGGDSYGLAIVPTDDTPPTRWTKVGKITEHLDVGRQSRGWRRRMNQVMDLCLGDVPFTVIGHNRKATHGDITERNQMPFVFGNRDSQRYIIGAHNGVISAHRQIAEQLDISDWHREVDSEVIFRGLQVKKPVEVLPLLSGGGSMAITWIENDPTKLYMFRNTNPLNMLFESGIMAWSSERSPLRYGASDITRKFWSTNPRKVYEFDVAACDIVDHSDTLEDESPWPAYKGSSRGGYTGYGSWSNAHHFNPSEDEYTMRNGVTVTWDKKKKKWLDKDGNVYIPNSYNSEFRPASSVSTTRRLGKGKGGDRNVTTTRSYSESCLVCSEEYLATRLVYDEDANSYCPWCAYAVFSYFGQSERNSNV